MGNVKSKAVEAGSNFLNSITNFFSQLPGKVSSFLTRTVSAIGSFVTNAVNKALEMGRNFVDNVTNTLSELPGKVANIGQSIVEGLWNGISGAATWLKDQITGFANSIIDGFKESFDINSPAKKMYPIGEFIDAGLGVGLENSDASEQAIGGKFDKIMTVTGNAVRKVGDFAKQAVGDIQLPEITVNRTVDNVIGENPVQQYKVSFDAQFSALNDGIDRLISLVGEYLPGIVTDADRPIVLDSGAVVGAISRKMDRELGKISVSKGRGNA